MGSEALRQARLYGEALAVERDALAGERTPSAQELAAAQGEALRMSLYHCTEAIVHAIDEHARRVRR